MRHDDVTCWIAVAPGFVTAVACASRGPERPEASAGPRRDVLRDASFSDAAAAAPMLGVDGCEGVELPAIVEIADRSRQLNRQCELRGEYDASRNYCLAALALQREGVSWQERAIVSQEQSSKPIVPSEYAAYMTTTETMIVVNPRRSGEVMISAMGEWKFYCVELTTEAVRLVLWKYITG